MRYVSLLSAGLLVLACNKPEPAKVDPDFDEHVATFKKKLGKLDEIKAAVASIPPVTEDKLDPAAKGSWTIIATDQLKDLGGCFEGASICGPEWTLLDTCKKDSNKTAEEVAGQYGGTQSLKQCASLKLLAVARKRSYTAPKADMKTKSYTGGEMVADVLVFDIDSAKHLGGFVVTAKTPDSLDKVPAGTDVDASLLRTMAQGFIESVKLKLGDPQR